MLRCAPQVMRFWGKAERVVAFKRQQAVEALKKEAMDKHLSFLLGQTQRYSSLLAQRLAPGSGDAPPQARSLPAAGGPLAGAAAGEAAAPDQEAGGKAARPLPDAAGADRGAGSAAAAGAGADDRNGGAHVGPDAAELEESRSNGEDEAEAEVEEEEEDDEATLEEEEVRAPCVTHLYMTHAAHVQASSRFGGLRYASAVYFLQVASFMEGERV